MTYPGYADGYEEASASAGVAGEVASITAAAPAGSLSSSTNVAGPPAASAWIVAAPAGEVGTSVSTPIHVALDGATATLQVRAPQGALSTSSGTAPSYPKGVPARLILSAPTGAVRATDVPTRGGGGSSTSTVVGVEASLLLSAPAGDVRGLVTGGIAGPSAGIKLVAERGEVAAFVVDRSAAVLTLTLVNTVVEVQPGTLTVRVTGGEPSSEVFFFLDNGGTPVRGLVLDEQGAGEVGLPINNMTVGIHTARVGASTVAPAGNADNMREFTVTGRPAGNRQSFRFLPPDRTAEVNRWVFQGYQDTASYTLPRNPERSSKVFGNFSFSAEATVVNSGRVIEWEGAYSPTPLRFTGRVFTQAEYQALKDWCSKQRFYITDHFGLRYLVRVSDLSVRRVRDRNRPWHHTYEVQCDVLAGDGVLT